MTIGPEFTDDILWDCVVCGDVNPTSKNLFYRGVAVCQLCHASGRWTRHLHELLDQARNWVQDPVLRRKIRSAVPARRRFSS